MFFILLKNVKIIRERDEKITAFFCCVADGRYIHYVRSRQIDIF